ncbi:hypothetical protein CHGG_02677 [Chaetomium globosum CBS 148.51]|uniref:Zn(2)-C6 fungal-type domain-containing protein n=1 Tax=Chaetomium globosum (strain ATCC 6205 / CBS 148.51 / DSM 1962 / NBRC 6347 / NRRL 1970) TaxID=306901 RepID=Q2HAS7_CHAGB|nr:uncharacterized protein CHGG_02677 [Chaetomium globosum CBS 148.51]EAQ90742.1 hypothetical protein CHGG_02677 [Chaetomium globosum CBS 148.51]
MELFARESTSPTQFQTPTPTPTAPPRLDTAFRPTTRLYPSPINYTMHFGASQQAMTGMAGMSPNGGGAALAGLHSESVSPHTVAAPKTVQFLLVIQEPPYQARLPLRVSIYPHDTTESIISTVISFWGLYPNLSKGLNFEDEQGNTIIPLGPEFLAALAGAQRRLNTDTYPVQGYSNVPRPTSRTSRVRSPSPNGGRGRRSNSTGANPIAGKKGRSRSSKNRVQTNGDGHSDSFSGYSSGDGAGSSSRSKEQLGNTDISVENILLITDRLPAQELPLFAPPQMPAATSNPSVSPARRADSHRAPLPFIQPGQNPFSNSLPLQSSRAYANGFQHSGMYATPSSDNRRSRGSFEFQSGQGDGSVMPTPEPTVRSAVSEEDKDVAMQLMRMSTHGRASGSTQDDTFSGRADAASSTGATSDADSCGEDDMPAARKRHPDTPSDHKGVFNVTESRFAGPRDNTDNSGEDTYSSDGADNGSMAAPTGKGGKLRANTLVGSKPRPQLPHKTKISKPGKPKAKKPSSITGPMTPASLPASRKQSIVSNPAFTLVPGEEEQPDLSTKPRCQRCRKSKKGCDRQRPCGRCRDAGIPAELCISEDEGNGRKGRYGRHMGVPVKNDMPPPATNLLSAAPIAPDTLALAMSAPSLLDKNKKRKR